MLIRKPLYLMAEAEGTGEGSEGAGESAGGAGAEQKSGEQQAEKTFTQSDLDRILAGRLAKFADYDDLKAKLSQVEDANATETERAIKAAREEARKEALTEATPRLVRSEFKAAAVGRMTQDQLAELLEDLDLSRYITGDGEVDTERIAKKIDALAPASEERKPAPSFGGGPRKPEPPARAGSLGEAIQAKLANPTR